MADIGWEEITLIRERLAKLDEAQASLYRTIEKIEMHLRTLTEASGNWGKMAQQLQAGSAMFEKLDEEMLRVKDDYRKMETALGVTTSSVTDLKNYFSSRVWIATTLVLLGMGLIDYAIRVLL